MKIPFVISALLISASALAEPAPVAHSLVLHVAPTSTVAGEKIELEAMIDAPFAETLVVRWRQIGTQAWQDVSFERSSAGGWYASIPAATSPGVEYFIRGKDSAGTEIDHFASEQSPHVVRVDPTLFDRLEELDRERLDNRVDEVSLEVVGHNFGNRYGLEDHYLRTEATYKHAFLRQLHEVGFGFGSISGKTPDNSDQTDGMSIFKGMRYGFGQVRMRLHPSVFVDARIGLGVSQSSFKGSGSGQLIFGKPWRSAVMVGAEYIGDLGGTGWVRLQWDTAPPLLMGASIVRTNLPGAVSHYGDTGERRDVAGLYIAYDVAYRIQNRFTVKAQLSYGARDGSAHVGGGVGTAVAF